MTKMSKHKITDYDKLDTPSLLKEEEQLRTEIGIPKLTLYQAFGAVGKGASIGIPVGAGAAYVLVRGKNSLSGLTEFKITKSAIIGFLSGSALTTALVGHFTKKSNLQSNSLDSAVKLSHAERVIKERKHQEHDSSLGA